MLYLIGVNGMMEGWNNGIMERWEEGNDATDRREFAEGNEVISNDGTME